MKLDKADVAYEHPASKPENHCGVCQHFDPPNACAIVAGIIRPEDWCKRFRRRIMDWSKWIDLAYDDEEMVDRMAPNMPEAPEYPYGMRLCLCERELEMLGLPLPKKGDQIDLRAFAEVTAVNDDASGQRVELQIQRLRMENESNEYDGDEDDDDE